MLEIAGLLLAFLGFIGCGDRLRQVNWHTSRPLVVAFYLVGAWWSLATVYHAVKTDLDWYELLPSILILLGLASTRHRWRHGPPADVTKPAPLGEPEISGFQ